MEKKAVVFDNSGTLLERYRVIKNLGNGELFTNINSLQLIDDIGDAALVILQFNTAIARMMEFSNALSKYIQENEINNDL